MSFLGWLLLSGLLALSTGGAVPDVAVLRVDGIPCRMRKTQRHASLRVVELFCGALHETASGPETFAVLAQRAQDAMSASPLFSEAKQKLAASRSDPLPQPGRKRSSDPSNEADL